MATDYIANASANATTVVQALTFCHPSILKRRVCLKLKQTQLGVPHSRINVELGFILLDSQFCSESKTELKCSRHRTKLEWGGGHHKVKVYTGRGGHHTVKVYTGRGDSTHIL